MRDIFIKAVSYSILLGVIIYSSFFIKTDLISRFDFTSFITAADIIKRGEGKNLYSVNVQSNFQKELTLNDSLILYRNPPTLALIFIPLSFFPLAVSYKFFVIIEIVLLIAAARLLCRRYPKIEPKLIFLYTAAFIPGLISVITGQISYLLLLDLIYISFFLERGNAFLVGVFSGFLFNKPQFLIFVPFLVLFVKDKKKFIEGLVLTLGIHIFVSYLLVGLQGLTAYLDFIKETESFRFSSDPYSQISFTSLLFNVSLFWPFLRGKEFLINLTVYLLVFTFFVLKYNKQKRDFFFNSAILFGLSFSPHVWDYDLTLVLLPLFFILNLNGTEKKKNTHPFYLLTLLYWGWLVRFFSYPFLTSLILIFVGSILFKLLPTKTITPAKIDKLKMKSI